MVPLVLIEPLPADDLDQCAGQSKVHVDILEVASRGVGLGEEALIKILTSLD